MIFILSKIDGFEVLELIVMNDPHARNLRDKSPFLMFISAALGRIVPAFAVRSFSSAPLLRLQRFKQCRKRRRYYRLR